MKIRLLCAAAAAAVLASINVAAQPVDPLESPTLLRNPASRLKPEPRRMSPSEASHSIAAAGVSQPAQPVVPQIAVPLGQGDATRAARTAATRRPQSAEAAPSAPLAAETLGSCEALAGDGMRALCLDRLAKANDTQ